MTTHDCRVVTSEGKVYDFVLGGRDTKDARSGALFTATHYGWVEDVRQIADMVIQERKPMATEDKVSAYGSKEKETKNQVRFTTEWGVVYIPKAQLEKLGNPERIKISVEGVEE